MIISDRIREPSSVPSRWPMIGATKPFYPPWQKGSNTCLSSPVAGSMDRELATLARLELLSCKDHAILLKPREAEDTWGKTKRGSRAFPPVDALRGENPNAAEKVEGC